eukprot:Hpha_TRINITY_DN26185_c0_g1::TRINITY_DN26185_c0_g1_i1::g.155431::m.155431
MAAVMEWTPAEVRTFLREAGFPAAAETLHRHQIDGPVLLTLTEADLVRTIGLETFGEARKLVWAVRAALMDSSSVPLMAPQGALVTPKKAPMRTTDRSSSGSSLSGRRTSVNELAMPRSSQALADPEIWTRESHKAIGSTVAKLMFSVVYLLLVALMTALVMVIVHDRVPTQETYPPLPDVILDNIPVIPEAFKAAEAMALVMLTMFALIVVLHRHRVVVVWRLFSITGSVFLLRCFTMYVTSLSVPGRHLECSGVIGVTLDEKMAHAMNIATGAGMSLAGVRSCGDYMFSGHTSILTLLNLSIIEYTPSNWRGIHLLCAVFNIAGAFCILLAHEHYTLDVFMAIYISSRVFQNYHLMANAGVAVRASRGMLRSVTGSQTWGASVTVSNPIFAYLEDETAGVLPNEYELPWDGMMRSYLKCRAYVEAYSKTD